MIIKRLPLLIAGGIGYVLGAKAGRERYEQLRSQFDKIKNDPRVQEKAQQAVDTAKQQAPVVADKVSSAASSATAAAKDKMSGSDDSTRQPHHMAGPQGDLP
jgi:hypothetical protein